MFLTWANAGGITGSGYLGSNPLGGIVTAFSTPTFNPTTHKGIFGGGGHVDSSCNAFVEFDLYALTYRQVAPATDPAKYPPSYRADLVFGNTYPSGAIFEFFHDGLTDSRDIQYNVTNQAPKAVHHFSSLCTRGNEMLKPGYTGVGWLNTVTGLWRDIQINPLGPALQTIGFAVGAGDLRSNIIERDTACEYDSVTDRVLMTVGPGDLAANSRGGLAFLNPLTMAFDNYIACGNVNYFTRTALVGRYLYVFNAAGPSNAHTTILQRINIDTKVLEYCSLAGDIYTWAEGAFDGGGCTPDPVTGNIYRWIYNTDRDALYALSTTPVSGLGTVGSPYVMQQTRIPLTASTMSAPTWCAERLHVAWGTVFIHHSDTGGWWACKL